MIIYSINNLPKYLTIGRQTEKGVTQIGFDCAEWLSNWSNLSLSAMVTPPNGDAAYPASTQMNGSVLVWTVNESDTLLDGKGTVEILGEADGLRKLSAIVNITILPTTTASTTEPPEAIKTWFDEVMEGVTGAEGSATRAADSANKAKASAETAQEVFDSIPEEYVALSDEVVALSEDIISISENGKYSRIDLKKIFGDFEDGTLGTDGVATPSGAPNRVRMKEIVYFPKGVEIVPKSGYMVKVHTYTGINGTHIKNHGFTANPSSFGECYLSVAIKKADDSNFSVNDADFDTGFDAFLEVLLKKDIRTKVDIYPSDDIHDFYTAMLNAYNSGNCDVYIHKGEYVYTDALMEEIRSRATLKRGVPIGNGCKYYFESGAKIICKYTGSGDVIEEFSVLDNDSKPSDYEIYNARIEAENIVYVIHDECSGESEPYRHHYENCTLSVKCGADGANLCKCIGGGMGEYGTITIRGCSFNTEHGAKSDAADISWHGSNPEDAINDVSIFVENCYFGNRMACSWAREGGAKLFFNGNSCKSLNFFSNESYAANWEIKAWNNEVRS